MWFSRVVQGARSSRHRINFSSPPPPPKYSWRVLFQDTKHAVKERGVTFETTVKYGAFAGFFGGVAYSGFIAPYHGDVDTEMSVEWNKNNQPDFFEQFFTGLWYGMQGAVIIGAYPLTICYLVGRGGRALYCKLM